ncbi:MAG: hypothetical protein IID33_15330 [Planctomycetes bacterium]|nr:hypothetical protein [Planctomycetota bacterium]
MIRHRPRTFTLWTGTILCALIATSSAWLWLMLLGTPAIGFGYFAPTLAWCFAAVAAPTLLVWRFWPKPLNAAAEERRGPNRGSRLLRIAKWSGTILSAACMIGAGMDTPAARYIWYTGGQPAQNTWSLFAGKTAAGIWFGSAGIGYTSHVNMEFGWPNDYDRLSIIPRPLGWSVGWPLDSVPWVGTRVGTPRGRAWGISSGFLAIMIGLPTALLWFLDRRHPPGHCPCGYDLTGNVSGRCPECGEAI